MFCKLEKIFPMKSKLTLFLFLFSFQIWAGSNELTDNDWYLFQVEIEGVFYDAPTSEAGYLTNFTLDHSSVSICNYLFMEYNALTDFNFTLTALSSTLMECPDQPELDEFEGYFSSLFWFYENQFFEYSISTDSEWTHIQILTITNPSGNKAYYRTNALGVNEFDSSIRIYPNPVIDILKVETHGQNLNEVHILDANGKFLSIQKLNPHSELNLKHLPKGIYFLEFHLGKKSKITRKIIKK